MRRVVCLVSAFVIVFGAASASAGNRCDASKRKNIPADADYLRHKLTNAMLGSLEFSIDGSVTNGVFDSNTIGQRAVSELNETEFVYGVGIGYVDRPILRDIHLLSGNAESLAEYRSCEDDPWRWALMDALTFSAGVGWGTVISPDEQRNGFETQDDLKFDVGLQYSVPLERIGFPYSDD